MEAFTTQEKSDFLNVSPTKTTQSWEPAISKVARAWMYDPSRAMQCLMERVAELQQLDQLDQRSAALPQSMGLPRSGGFHAYNRQAANTKKKIIRKF